MDRNENWVWVLVIVLLVLFLFGGFSGMMGWRGGYGMMGNYFGSNFGFTWIFMLIIWVLVIIALVLGIMWLTRQLQQPQNQTPRRKK